MPHICIATKLVRKRYMVVKVLNGFEKIAFILQLRRTLKRKQKKDTVAYYTILLLEYA